MLLTKDDGHKLIELNANSNFGKNLWFDNVFTDGEYLIFVEFWINEKWDGSILNLLPFFLKWKEKGAVQFGDILFVYSDCVCVLGSKCSW